MEHPPARSRRPIVLALVAALLLVAAGGGFWWWRDRQRVVDAANAYAQRAAAALAKGSLPEPVVGVGRTAASTELTAILKGMGTIRPRVSVVSVALGDDRQSGTVTFANSWTIHEGKSPWATRTTMPIVRAGDGWAGRWSPTVVAPDLKAGERLVATRLTPTRGDVLGDGGQPLVTARAVVRVGIDRSGIPDDDLAANAARRLAAVVDVDAAAFADRVAGAGDAAVVEAITYRADSGDLEAARPRLTGIPGVRLVEGTLPLAPTSAFARAVLGTVGDATAEIVAKSKGRVRTGDVTGLSGLQASQDEKLFGTSGFVVLARPETPPGATVDPKARELYRVDATDGQDVTTTLSLRHELAAEAALNGVDPASAIVAIRPSDGHVLAAASGPGSKGRPTATLGTYAPGSTFKVVTSLGLIRAGLTPDSPVTCPQTTVVDGRTFKNYDNYPASRTGTIPLRTAIAQSCNTALMTARDKLGANALPQAAAALGLTGSPSLGVPAELGSVPEPRTEVDRAASMIGQGKVLATPLGMATVAASISHGAPVSPVLVVDAAKPAAPAGPVTGAEAETLRTLMRGVVDGGTASFLADVPGEPVLAKTGTAEYGSDDPPRSHAWMIGIQGDLAVAVFVADGKGGAATAGPLLEDFLRRVQAG
jgi:cell division protein FtsI/penicillin-binding protein 2